ncbi:hypothetical protein ACTRXD_19295 [Nitrospira sp. T9]|uniref:hypothetical protein n=1 Tax=unclassified Nitrospira TaxID=2652172 RepID=UPI003F9E2102
MWEIAEALKLGYRFGRRAFARVWLGTDPSLLLRVTMRDAGGFDVGRLPPWRKEGGKEDGFSIP